MLQMYIILQMLPYGRLFSQGANFSEFCESAHNLENLFWTAVYSSLRVAIMYM